MYKIYGRNTESGSPYHPLPLSIGQAPRADIPPGQVAICQISCENFEVKWAKQLSEVVVDTRPMDMAKPKEPINPFYVLTAIFGVLFTITACGYGLLMLRSNRAAASPTPEPIHPLMNLLDLHGMQMLSVEVGLLAVVSVAAIWLDHYRGKRIASKNQPKSNEE
jgi:hypothetical protein